MIVTRKQRQAALRIYDKLEASPDKTLPVATVRKTYNCLSDARHNFVSSSFRILKELDIARGGTINETVPRADGRKRAYFIAQDLPRAEVIRMIDNYTPPR